jgi:hypothetical protein
MVLRMKATNAERKGRKARKVLKSLLIFAGLAGLAFHVGRAQSLASSSSEWRSYAGDLRNLHDSPLSEGGCVRILRG